MPAGQRARVYDRLRARRLKLSGLLDYAGLGVRADFKTAPRRIVSELHGRALMQLEHAAGKPEGSLLERLRRKG